MRSVNPFSADSGVRMHRQFLPFIRTMTPKKRPARSQPAPVGIRKQLLKAGERDSEVSQRAILEAATSEFSQRGLEGARVDQIADAAGINKQLLYRYFGSKDDLYLRVLEDVYFRFREGERDLGLAQLEPESAIRTFIGSMVERIHSQHHFARLVIDENFHEGRHLKHSDRVRVLHAEMLTTIEGVLQRGAKAGVFRKGVDALQLFTAMAGLSTFYVTNMHTLSAIFGKRFDKLDDAQVITTHIEQMIFGFIAADPTAFLKAHAKAAKPRVARPRSKSNKQL